MFECAFEAKKQRKLFYTSPHFYPNDMTDRSDTSERTPSPRSIGTPRSSRTPSQSVYSDSPRDERHFVHRTKDRWSSQRTFRDSIRTIYHESDFTATFRQTSALVAPLEATPKRPVMGKTSYTRDILPSPDKTPPPSRRSEMERMRKEEEERQREREERLRQRDQQIKEELERRREERQKKQELERQRKLEEEKRRRERQLAEEAERKRREEIRRQQEEEERERQRKKREEEEMERQRKAAEARERERQRKAEAEERERQRKAEEERERQRKAEEEMERQRKAAEEERERQRKAEEEERERQRRAEEEEKERQRRAEEEERERLRKAEEEERERQRRAEEEEEERELQRKAEEAERERQRAQAEEEESERQRRAAEEEKERLRVKAEEEERERQRAKAEEEERERQRAQAEEEERERQRVKAEEAERERQRVKAEEEERERQRAQAEEEERERQRAQAEEERERQRAQAEEEERQRQRVKAEEEESERQRRAAEEEKERLRAEEDERERQKKTEAEETEMQRVAEEEEQQRDYALQLRRLTDQDDQELSTPRRAFPPKKEMYISPTVSKYSPDDPSLEHHGSQLLEISTRPYLYALCEKYRTKITKLRDIPIEEFDELQSLGFQWVWFMGIWQLGENCLNHDRCDHYLRDRYSNVCPGWSVEDVIGYPLCIVSYTVNNELGTEEDLVWLRQQLNTRGMKLMLDFVPNHTAIDAPEFSEHPDWYLHANFHDPKRFMANGIAFGAGKWIPPMYFSAQLDMTSEDTRRFQIDNLKSIAKRCDGVRVHVAHFCLTDLFMEQWNGVVDPSRRPPTEFWEEAIREVRSESPDFMIMAETYGIEIQKQLLSLGFDYIYDKELLDDLTDSNLDHFRYVVATQNVADMEHFVHFVENHDEARSIERFYNNPKMSCAAAAALLSLPGLRLVNFHQWLGYTYKIDVHLRRSLPEHYLRDTLQFYTRFLRVLQTDAVRYGSWHLVDVYDASTVLAWKWVKDEQHILVTVNFCGCNSGGRIVCDDVPCETGTVNVKELIQNVVYERDAEELARTGLCLLLSPYQVQVFEY